MKYLIIFILLALFSCSDSSPEGKSDPVKRDIKKNEQKKMRPPCKEKIINLENGVEFNSIECEIEKSKEYTSLIVLLSKTTVDTLDVTQCFVDKTGNSSPNLILKTIKNNSGIYEAQYYYEGCVGDLCAIVLVIQFKIDKKDKIVLYDIFEFDLVTKTKNELVD